MGVPGPRGAAVRRCGGGRSGGGSGRWEVRKEQVGCGAAARGRGSDLMRLPDGMVTMGARTTKAEASEEAAAAVRGRTRCGKGSGLGVLEVGLAELAATSV